MGRAYCCRVNSMNAKASRPGNSMLGAAHALHASLSLCGILLLPWLMLLCRPDAPIVRPLTWLRKNLEPGTFSLVNGLGAMALWLLILSRIYDLRAILRGLKRALRDKDASLASPKECVRLD